MAKRSFYKQSTNVEAAATATVLEVNKPSKFTQHVLPHIQLPKPAHWTRWLLFSGIMFSISMMLFFGLVTSWYINTFNQSAKTSIIPTFQTIWANRNNDPFSQKSSINILLLGLDQSKNFRENSMLTDTIAIVNIHRSGRINLVSIPRDLWIESLKTKINALYYYGEQSNSSNGIALTSSVVSEISGITLDYYMVISMDTIKDLVDALNGITVNVERSFTDTQYPREIDLTSKDPAILYETIQFNAGPQLLDGATALKYIRSRHSTDEIEGTDEGREKRQQQIIKALIARLKTAELIANPKITGSLYQVWKNDIKSNLDDVTLALLVISLKNKPLNIQQYTIPIKTADTDGLIYHPLKGPSKQWVYQPIDPSWITLQKWVYEHIDK